MEKKKKLMIIGISLFIMTLGVSAATIMHAASDVTYSSSSLSGSTVKAALDNLVTKCQSSTTTCPSGMTCTNKTNIKCKRATTLHTETCSQTSSYCAGAGYSSGSTITYGNTSTTSGVLTTGDAFDCDVNGDGTFNATNERFYYVSNYYDTSTKNFNDKVAVLIYYSNVRGGVANTAATAYNSTSQNYNGPVTAKPQLPTTTQWGNISLYKTSRQILAETNATSTSGGTLPTNFSYAGYAARLLTYQEAYNGCYNYETDPHNPRGLDTKCKFLMEGTKFSNSSLASYGPLLESPYASEKYLVNGVDATSRNIIAPNAGYTMYGARPTIEVLKSQISY